MLPNDLHRQLWRELEAHPDDGPGIYGRCALSGRPFGLPRLPTLEQLCRQWAQELPESPGRQGKMFGLLWAGDRRSSRQLRAYSGLTPIANDEDFVPPIPLQQRPAGEAAALAALDELKQQLIELELADPRGRLQHLQERCKSEVQALRAELEEGKCQRDWRRQQPDADLEQLARESEEQAYRMRDLKRAHKAVLGPVQEAVQQWEAERLEMRRQRKSISRQLQFELHQHFERSLFPHAPGWTERLYPRGLPTGTGECCAPKLLYAAAQDGLRPLAMAEFWRGPELPGRQPNQFYPACQERCQPLLGPLYFLLEDQQLPSVVYQDPYLLVINKPPGLLSVPGRQSDYQDSALLRLGRRYPELRAVHRLDFETSGLLMFARNRPVQAALQRLFETRQVKKTYLAQLQHELPDCLENEQIIEAPIAPDPARRGCYRVDNAGRPARTRWRCEPGSQSRLRLWPETGRSHQLRVHLFQVLGSAILGDPKYGQGQPRTRLHLQALELELPHPVSGRTLRLSLPPDF